MASDEESESSRWTEWRRKKRKLTNAQAHSRVCMSDAERHKDPGGESNKDPGGPKSSNIRNTDGTTGADHSDASSQEENSCVTYDDRGDLSTLHKSDLIKHLDGSNRQQEYVSVADVDQGDPSTPAPSKNPQDSSQSTQQQVFGEPAPPRMESPPSGSNGADFQCNEQDTAAASPRQNAPDSSDDTLGDTSDAEFFSSEEDEPRGSNQSSPSSDDPDDPDDEELSGQSESSDSDLHLHLDSAPLATVLECWRRSTVKEALILILAQASRFHHFYESVITSCGILNTILGRKVFPTSKKQLWMAINKTSDGVSLHAYCKNCKAPMKKLKDLNVADTCPLCGEQVEKKTVKTFATLSLRQQFQDLLNIPGINEVLSYQNTRRKEDPDAVEDIYDGECIKRLRDNGIIGENDFVYAFNTDGFEVGRSSHRSVWPLLVRFFGLPPELRQMHMFLAGLWVDVSEPEMNTFLKPFVSQANKLATEGLNWKPDGINEITSRFHAVCCSADSKARCCIFNLRPYNSYYGCTMCYFKGLYAAGSMRYPINPTDYSIPEPLPRTHDGTVSDMREAVTKGTPVRGVAGASQLINLDNFDLIKGQAVDALHAIWLGTGAAHTLLFWNTVGAPYFIEAVDKKTINSRLLSFKPPDSVARKPRELKAKGKWKATEWRNWLLFYAVVCLEGCIPQKYIDHFAMLSHGIFLLSQRSITSDDFIAAQRLLTNYVRLYQEYFSVDNMNYNVHLISHLLESVRELGPTWVYSTCGFESWNNALGKMITSPTGVVQQIVTRFHIRKLVTNAVHNADIPLHVRSELKNILFKARLKNSLRVEDAHVLGTGVVRESTPQERALLQEKDFAADRFTTYQRIIVSRGELHCVRYRPQGSSDNTNFVTSDNVICSVCDVVVFGEPNVCGIFAEEYSVVSDVRHARHIAKVRESGLMRFVVPSEIKSLAFTMTTSSCVFAVAIPNKHEID